MTDAVLAEATTLTRLKALANDLRFEIVRILAHGERCVCDLEGLLELPQSKVSYHLATLVEAGIIEGEKRGKNSYYRLKRNALYSLGGEILQELLTPVPELVEHLNLEC